MGRKPDKVELARMKVMGNMGIAPTAIAKKIGRSHHLVIKYLSLPEKFEDMEVKTLVEKIRQNELHDLYLLGAKARRRLHELMDEGKTKTIETVALMDRSFQQRRLLEGQSTQNISYIELVIEKTKLLQEMKKLEEQYPELKELKELKE